MEGATGYTNTEGGGVGKNTFVQHVFNFNEESKCEMMNIVQYTIVGLVPIVMLNKLMQSYVPEADDEKGTIELLAEVVIQSVVMFMGILITNRIVTYVPTYSEVKYEKVSVNQIVLAVLMITLSLQTKLGEKVSILYDRAFEMVMGKSREGMCAKKNTGSSQNGDDSGAGQNQGGPGGLILSPQSASPPLGTTDIRGVPNDYSGGQGGGQGNNAQSNVPAPGGDSNVMAANDVLGGGLQAFSGW